MLDAKIVYTPVLVNQCLRIIRKRIAERLWIACKIKEQVDDISIYKCWQ